MESKVRLYELVMENGRSASPFVWRIRYSLAHKGIAWETVPLGLTDIPKQFGGRFKTVPIIEDGATAMNESWDIADYLDRTFPDRRPLFCSESERATVRLLDSWLSTDILRKMFRVYALDVHNAARPEDRPYFRSSRERWLKGVTLEEYTSDRVTQLHTLREALQPLRSHLTQHSFLGGSTPNYADYIALGLCQWIASVSTLPMLAADDHVLKSWLDRGFDQFNGLGRDPRMHPLFE
jgi:glutathione S-transferase